MNVETNIRKTFLKLIDKHFPKSNKFHKIFNRNNVKVSCSCLPNFAKMIKSHNNRILPEEKTQDQPKIRCTLKENTPSDGVNYNDLTENTFKDRFYKHCNFFKCESRQTLQNYLSNSGKWKGKASKNQSCIGQLLIMLNHIRTGLQGATYV